MKANINPRQKIGLSSYIKKLFQHYALIPEPLMYISGFHHSSLKDKEKTSDVILNDLLQKFNRLNQICLDSDSKYLHNIPNEIIHFNYDEGIKIRDSSLYLLTWDNEKHEFQIKGEGIPNLSVSKSHKDFRKIYQTLTNLVNDKKRINEKVQKWINTLNISFKFETNLDYEHGILNIIINEIATNYNDEFDRLTEIFHVYQALNSSSQEFKFEDGWKCNFIIKVNILDDNTNLFIDFMKNIPKNFDSADKLLYQGKREEIIEFLNLLWINHSTINLAWNEENLKKCLYNICINQRNRIYDVLLARLLEEEVF